MSVSLEAAWERIGVMIDEFIAQLPNFLLALILFIIIYLASRWLRGYAGKLAERSGRSRNASTVVELIVHWSLLLLGALVALSIALPSFAPADLIQILGVGGVAVGFAFRDIFENFFAGLIILLTDAFEIGDQIVVNDLEGTVEKIETRATIMRTYDGREIVIPNAELFTNAVTVNTSRSKRRSQYDVGISYDADIDEAIAVLDEAVKSVDGVLSEPASEILVADLAGSSVNLRARWWTEAEQKHVVHIKSDVIRAMKYALDDAGIDIPYPIRTVLLPERQEAESEDERAREMA